MNPLSGLKTIVSSFILFTCYFLLVTPSSAIVDPLASPNNKFGIHILSTTPDEASPAAALVNSSGGDWGYVTVLVESKNRKHDLWQAFFDDLRRRHLIPLVRIATEPDGGNWKRPYEGEETAWADFLDKLVWPTKNRYVIIYNEPNHAQEWVGSVDPVSYAKVLDQTITALKNKNDDFFVLNAGFDASAPGQPPRYGDEAWFLSEMNKTVPGIFNKLDGWVSHSYPNPGFRGSPNDYGRGTVRGWQWELDYLKSLGLNKNLPVFITETGWQHAEGKTYNKSLPSSDVVARYFQQAFEGAWSNSQIVAITPFLLNYQEDPFDHFSFKKLTGEPQNKKILGTSYPEYYSPYQALIEMSKIPGRPVQERKAEVVHGGIYNSMVSGEKYSIPITFKNTGQAIWGERGAVELRAIYGGEELGINNVSLDDKLRIEPGKEAIFYISVNAPSIGSYQASFQLFEGDVQFDSSPVTFVTNVKSPVMMVVMASLPWKKGYSGDYTLAINSEPVNSSIKVVLDNEGKSDRLEVRYLLPDYNFSFSLSKPFYKTKTIQRSLGSGVNVLDFGKLEPDLLSALLHPKQLWEILPKLGY